jgi:hypothetical protein
MACMKVYSNGMCHYKIYWKENILKVYMYRDKHDFHSHVTYNSYPSYLSENILSLFFSVHRQNILLLLLLSAHQDTHTHTHLHIHTHSHTQIYVNI